MDPKAFLNILHVAERLKDALRHCCTSHGRPESVAEHSWRIALMAMLLREWVASLPPFYAARMESLYAEMNAQQTLEARLYKSLDKLEAVIQHNESPIGSWLPNEYELNLTYAFDQVAFSPYLTALREQIRLDTEEKIADSKKAP